MMSFHIIVKLYFLIFFTFCSFNLSSSSSVPYTLKSVGISENIGSYIDPNLNFLNYDDSTIKLNDFFFQGKPLVVFFGYYSCPMLCHFVANGVVNVVNKSKLSIGKDFNLLMVSINPDDNIFTASQFASEYLSKLSNDHDLKKWFFVTSKDSTIKAFTSLMGFNYRYDTKSEEFAHSAAIMIISPKGKITRYLYGIDYSPFDFRMALVESNKENITSSFEKLLLFCYNYDPLNKKYTLLVNNLLKLGGIAIIIFIIFIMWYFGNLRSNRIN